MKGPRTHDLLRGYLLYIVYFYLFHRESYYASHFWSLLAARRAFFFLGSLCLLCAQATQLALYGTYSQQRPPHECQLPDLGRIEDRER